MYLITVYEGVAFIFISVFSDRSSSLPHHGPELLYQLSIRPRTQPSQSLMKNNAASSIPLHVFNTCKTQPHRRNVSNNRQNNRPPRSALRDPEHDRTRYTSIRQGPGSRPAKSCLYAGQRCGLDSASRSDPLRLTLLSHGVRAVFPRPQYVSSITVDGAGGQPRFRKH